MTKKQSLDQIVSWLSGFVQYILNENSHGTSFVDPASQIEQLESTVFMILGNKCEEKDELEVDQSDIDRVIEEIKMQYQLTPQVRLVSAKSDIGIDEAFLDLAKRIHNNEFQLLAKNY